MNPELERNLWLELTPRRLLLMPLVLALIFVAVGTSEGELVQGLGWTARALFFVIVVLWGTRMAAGAVVGEIRDRTWDGQRLSALSPLQMMVGKLLGATSYQWYGGVICLFVIAALRFREDGPGAMLSEILYFLAIGLFAQSASLFASLLAVRRRASHTRFDVFIYQIAGLAVAGTAASLWDIEYLSRALTFDLSAFEGAALTWYGTPYLADGFKLVSLFAFLGWSLLGNLTLLRAELQARTGPWPWIGFVLFMVVYWAGFGEGVGAGGEGVQLVRTAIAIQVAALLTYAAMLIEPKDPVIYRWFLGALARGRVDQALGALQAWMAAFAVLAGLVVYFLLTFEAPKTPNVASALTDFLPFDRWFAAIEKAPAVVLAGFLFVARDMAIFLYFNFAPGARRGDFGALVSLGLLYLVLPAILAGFGQSGVLALVLPGATSSVPLMIAAPGIEAAAAWALAIVRLRGLMARDGAEAAPARAG